MNKKEFINATWVVSEKLVSIIGLFFVTTFVAKYVGPSIFGQISYALAIFQIVQIISQLGSETLLFKRISQNVFSGVKLIKHTTKIRFILYILISFPVLFYFLLKSNGSGLIFIFAACLSCLFLSMDVYSIYNDARLRSKINTIVNFFGLSISLVVRYFIAYFEFSPKFLAIPMVLVSLIPLVIRYYFFVKEVDCFEFSKSKRERWRYSRFIIGAGSLTVISTISITIYARVNQFVLNVFCGDHYVGIYNCALGLASCWIFVLYSFINSLLPSFFSEKDLNLSIKKIRKINLIVLSISVPIVIIAYFFSERIIMILYGSQYIESILLLKLLVFATPLSALNFVATRVIIKYSNYKYLAYKSLFILFFYFFSSIIFIKEFGYVGAAYSTLVSEALSLTLANYFFKKGFILQTHIYTKI